MDKHTPTHDRPMTAEDIIWALKQKQLDAAFIVRAVNQHQELRDLLGRCHSWISDHSEKSVDEPLAREVYEAIALAEGK